MKLIVKDGIAGRGVFAAEPAPAAARLIRFTGPLLRRHQTTPQTLAVQIGPDLYLGASGGMDDYVNHSCRPNAGPVSYTHLDVYKRQPVHRERVGVRVLLVEPTQRTARRRRHTLSLIHI